MSKFTNCLLKCTPLNPYFVWNLNFYLPSKLSTLSSSSIFLDLQGFNLVIPKILGNWLMKGETSWLEDMTRGQTPGKSMKIQKRAKLGVEKGGNPFSKQEKNACFLFRRFWKYCTAICLSSLKLTAKAPANKPSQKETIVFGPSIFRCGLLVSGRVIAKEESLHNRLEKVYSCLFPLLNSWLLFTFPH